MLRNLSLRLAQHCSISVGRTSTMTMLPITSNILPSSVPMSMTTTTTWTFNLIGETTQRHGHCPRLFHTTHTNLMPLSEFRDPVSRQQRLQEPVGRSWSVKELRRKSYDDMQKLWYVGINASNSHFVPCSMGLKNNACVGMLCARLVLYKERNMLLTEQQLSRRKSLRFPQPERIRKVRKSMQAIRQVLGERKREHLARLAAARQETEKNNNDEKKDDQQADIPSSSADDSEGALHEEEAKKRTRTRHGR